MEGGDASADGTPDWKRRGQDAYRASTSYIDNNLRAQWEDSLRAFHSQHSAQSKYNSQAFEKRSRLFRPKTRTIIRKNEAAAAAAFFSNMDIVDIQAQNGSDKQELASAEIMKELLQYRLTKDIKWFHTVLGGLQEAQAIGVVCAHIYWDYLAKPELKVQSVDVEPLGLEEEVENPAQPELPEGAFTLGDAEPKVEVTAQPVAVDIQAEVKPKPLKDRP